MSYHPNRIISQGSGTLTAGTTNVNDSKVTSSTRIILTARAALVNAGALSVTASTNGVGFTVRSTNVLDARAFDYIIIETI